MQVGTKETVLLLTLAGYLLIGRGFQAALQNYLNDRQSGFTDTPVHWGTISGAFIVLFVTAAINFGSFLRRGPGFNITVLGNINFFLAAFCLLVILILIVTFYFVDSPSTIFSTFVLLVTIVCVMNWGVGWRLSHLSANDPREPWISNAVDDELHLLIDVLNEAGRDIRGTSKALTIFSSVDSAVMRWYLRDFPLAQFGEVVPIGTIPDVVIAYEDSDPALGSDYSGSDFGFTLDSQFATSVSSIDALKWWIFGDQLADTDGDRVVVWVRADLLTGSSS